MRGASGIANFTLLPVAGDVRGFDTGPANALMDAWCERHRGTPYDAHGAFAPGIHQRIRRARVEPAHVARDGQQREVRDAAEVEHGARFVRVVQHRRVESGHERRALSAGGEIAAAEIGDGVDARAFGDDVAIADLPGERMCRRRSVPDRLSVRTDRAHIVGRDLRRFKQLQRRARERFGDLHVERTEFVERCRIAALAERDEPGAQRDIPFECTTGDERAMRAVEAHERGIDAVGARAGNQAEVEPSVAQAFFFFAGFGAASA